jgi:hypothetical protein
MRNIAPNFHTTEALSLSSDVSMQRSWNSNDNNKELTVNFGWSEGTSNGHTKKNRSNSKNDNNLEMKRVRKLKYIIICLVRQKRS